MRFLFTLFIICLCFSCKNKTREDSNKGDKKTENQTKKEITTSTEKYTNEEWNFSLEYPVEFELAASELAGNAPVINIYPENSNANLPLAIHEKPEIAYIAILPKAFGVDGPSGRQSDFSKFATPNPFNIEIDETRSQVYQLENGEAWAYFLRFEETPSNWDKFGGIFVHFKISDFKAECYDPQTETIKKMDRCDPMGNDKVKFSGKIDAKTKEQLVAILNSIKFKTDQKQDISDLIQVEKPLPNKDVTSPLTLKGKARGYWFFEASAPIEILDQDFNKIAKSYIEAEGEWMTRDFVNFTGSIKFEAPDDERGYLVFKSSNPSDKKENEREYRIPIIFPPK